MDTAIQVYWRRGCGFCSSLIGQLERFDVPLEKHNIWDDDDAAEIVRRAARGHETVPTIGINGHYLVNPRLSEIVALAREVAPELAAGMETVKPERRWFKK